MEKVKQMKNGYKLQAYPIKLQSNDFPSGQDKTAEAQLTDIHCTAHGPGHKSVARWISFLSGLLNLISKHEKLEAQTAKRIINCLCICSTVRKTEENRISYF